jgi:hypothetical protein
MDRTRPGLSLSVDESLFEKSGRRTLKQAVKRIASQLELWADYPASAFRRPLQIQLLPESAGRTKAATTDSGLNLQIPIPAAALEAARSDAGTTLLLLICDAITHLEEYRSTDPLIVPEPRPIPATRETQINPDLGNLEPMEMIVIVKQPDGVFPPDYLTQADSYLEERLRGVATDLDGAQNEWLIDLA